MHSSEMARPPPSASRDQDELKVDKEVGNGRVGVDSKGERKSLLVSVGALEDEIKFNDDPMMHSFETARPPPSERQYGEELEDGDEAGNERV